jgi:hypothetical protein
VTTTVDPGGSDSPLPDPGDVTASESTPPLANSFEAANFDTNGQNANIYFIPPDPHGAVGPSHVLNVVNVSIQWYTKQGVQQHNQSLKNFFAPLGAVNFLFDPKVVYDEHAGRFVVVALEKTDVVDGANSDTSRILVAVSDDSDPNGTWRFQAINGKIQINGTNTWADYPGLAVDEQAVYITNNMFAFKTNGSNYRGSRLWIVPKGAGSGGFYDGGAATVNVFDPSTLAGNTNWNYFTLQPTHVRGTGGNGASDGVWLVSSDVFFGSDLSQEGIAIVRIQNPLSATPTFNRWNFNLGNISSTMSPPDVPQLGTSTLIDAGDLRMFDAEWRDNNIYAVNQIVPNTGADAGQVTAHWYRISTQGGVPSIQDQGNIGAEDIGTGTHTYYPSVTVDADSNLAFGFAASSSNLYGGAYYTVRGASDPPGTVQSTGTLKAGEDFYIRTFGGSRNRWGDYSAIDIDPASENTFWVYNEYAMPRGTDINGEVGRWGTRWGQFYLNVPPTVSLANAVTALDEDADVSAGLKVADIVVADDGQGNYNLALTGADQGLFELRAGGAELWLKDGTLLDFETNDTLDVSVEVDDPAVGSDPDDSAALVINIGNVDEVPQIELVPVVTNLAENVDSSAVMKVADIVITDDTVGSRTIWLSGPDSAKFKIIGLAVYLKAGSILDYETNPSLDVTININDAALGGSPDDTDSLAISITAAGDAPTGLDLSANAVTENQPPGSVLGTLSSSDSDAGETFTYAAATGPGDDDNVAFDVDPDTGEVTTAASFDFETQSSLSFRVRTTDAEGLWFERAFTITVINANDAPQISFDDELAGISEDADTSSATPVADIVISNDSLGSQTYYILGGLNDGASLFEIDGATGQLVLRAGAVLNHETNLELNVTIVVDDSSLGSSWDNSVTLALAVTDANDSPTIEAEGSEGQSATYFEQDPPVALIEEGIVEDEDGAVLPGATLQAAILINATESDRLLLSSSSVSVAANGNVSYNGKVIGTLTASGLGGAPLQVTLNSQATLWSIRKVLQSVRFETLGDHPSDLTRQVLLRVTDGAGGISEEVLVGVQVVRVNDAPVLSNAPSPALRTIWEDARSPRGTPLAELVQAAITDVDFGALRGVAIVGAAAHNGTWQYRLEASTTWQVMGEISDESALLLPVDATTQVRFVPNRNYSGQVWLRYRAWDRTQGEVGQKLSLVGQLGGINACSAARESAALTVIAVNDKPVIHFGSHVGYLPGRPAVVLSPYARLRDVDSPDFDGGQLRIQITSGADASNHLGIGGVFTVSGMGGIFRAGIQIGTLNAKGGIGTEDLVVSFNAKATQAIVQELLRSITFRTLKGSRGIRQAVFTLSDGDGATSQPVTKTINLT